MKRALKGSVAKGPKTIDAPSGLIGVDGRQAARRAEQLAEPVLSLIEVQIEVQIWGQA
jgi:hypothetical protein